MPKHTRSGETIVHKYSEPVLQWLEDKGAINCGQCRQNRWDEEKVEVVVVLPVGNLPADNLRQLAQVPNTAYRVVCQHCGNILLIDQRIMILNEEPRDTSS